MTATLFYIQIIGPYDAVFQGPYPDRPSADAAAAAIAENFDRYVVTDEERQADFDEFGPIPIVPPPQT